MRRDDLSGGDFKRRKQRCRAMPLVVVALARQGAAIGQLQIALRSLQSLDRRLFVHAEHNGPLGRGDIEANDIGGFGRKVRVVALAPGFASHEVNLVAAQEPPDILDVDIAQHLGQQGPGPACDPLRWRLIQQLQNPLVGRLRINRLLARPRLVFQPFKAMVGIAVPPKADNPRLDPDFLGDRPGAAPGRRQQNDPRPLQIALQYHRRATTRLKHLAIFPRKVNFSCFGYHPDLESRLTLQEKWVLVLVGYLAQESAQGQNLKSAPTLSRYTRRASSASRRIRLVAWQGLCDLASALGEQQRHPADRPMSLERGATFPSVARPRWADPKPKYALSQPKCTYGSTSVQWFGPSVCDYAWGVTADVSSGKTTGG